MSIRDRITEVVLGADPYDVIGELLPSDIPVMEGKKKLKKKIAKLEKDIQAMKSSTSRGTAGGWFHKKIVTPVLGNVTKKLEKHKELTLAGVAAVPALATVGYALARRHAEKHGLGEPPPPPQHPMHHVPMHYPMQRPHQMVYHY